jgi:hypothetical protein
MMKNEKGWRGVFTETSLPKKIKNYESGIVNYDDDGPGTHWVCYYNNGKSNVVEFFDSYGLPPSDKIILYLNKSGKRIMYNDSQLQQFSSVMCGYYCVRYLKSRNKGLLPSKIIYEFEQYPSDLNEVMIRKLFS